MSIESIIVVGAGQAGLQICDSLRKGGYSGKLTLIGDEPSLPYQRPPLSKKFLLGELSAERLYFRPENYFEKINTAVLTDVTVSAIDRAAHSITLSDGRKLSYDKLALATGTRVRPLSCPGADDADIFYVRTLKDSEQLASRLEACTSVAIIGGGFIGLEVAAIARALGKTVHVIEAQDRLMARAVSPIVSEFYAARHEAAGSQVHLNSGVNAINRTGRQLSLELSDQSTLNADIIVAGIGVLANEELAAAAGLDCNNGIVVDEYACTNDADIVAAGDCTYHLNGFLGRKLRLESVQNAVDQAKTAAMSLLGQLQPYHQVPWFWSDQYDLKLQIAGVPGTGDKTVVRGDPASNAFSVFYFDDGKLTAAETINRPAEHMACRKLLQQGTMLGMDEAADAEFDLMALAKRDAAKPGSDTVSQ